MVQLLTFYGASDDLFCYQINRVDRDEFDCYDCQCNLIVASTMTGERLRITGQFAPGNDGTWMIGFSQVSIDDQIPRWAFRWTRYGPYSIAVHIDAPDDVTITRE